MPESNPSKSSQGNVKDDSPTQAMEAGEPGITRRQHGRDADAADAADASSGGGRSAGQDQGKSGSIGEDFESGRQDAAS